ncbi:MAG: LamG domain-containing protein [Planctomycetes bacterium]|nr:LamG domain-containing protein [Planctomycetota bacterium]
MNLSTLSVGLAVLGFAAQAQAQTCTYYWSFNTLDDSVGGVIGQAVGTVDTSVHATYGEAFPGAGNSLNSVLGGTSTTGGFIAADTSTAAPPPPAAGGSPTAMDFGTGDFAISFWAYDDTSDGDLTKGPRVIDSLSTTTTGLQFAFGTVCAFRIDSSGGQTCRIDGTNAIPTDQWFHVVVNCDRTNGVVSVYYNGVLEPTVEASSGFVPFSTLTGSIYPSQDMQIGVINEGASTGNSQNSGLDDLAFYSGLLSASDIAGLAAGTITPLGVGGPPLPGTSFCYGDGSGTPCPCGNGAAAGEGCANGTGAGSILAGTGSASIGAGDLVLTATQVPVNQPTLFFQGDNAVGGGAGTVFGDGLRCAGGNVVRLQVRVADASGAASTTVNVSTQGGVVMGDVKRYQAWYRDPVGSPCGSFFNLSSGYEITWGM